jgi:probable rRNA maturation factor
MPVVVSNLQEAIPVDETLTRVVASVTAYTLQSEGYGDEAEVSVVFMDDGGIRRLNREYRGVDEPTDVLSFPMHERDPGAADGEAQLLLGDVVISLERAYRQAKAFGHSLHREVAYLTVHGILHLLGYDHDSPGNEQTMRAKEEDVLAKLNLSR